MSEIKLNSIEDAVKDFKEGKFVIVVDDEDRENEGDLIIAAEKIDAEKVNFMLKHARGVLCAPITLSRCDELDLPHQVSENTSVLGTPFTITVDKLEGCSTGVSAHAGKASPKFFQQLQISSESGQRPVLQAFSLSGGCTSSAEDSRFRQSGNCCGNNRQMFYLR